MRRLFLAAVLGCAASTAFAQTNAPTLDVTYADTADKLVTAATNSNFAYQRLAELCDTFGPRFSGSTNLESAIDWVLAEMKKDGLENVHGEQVMVPHWVRGEESAELIEPRHHTISMLGCGGSVGTPPEGITAPVLVVTNFEDLTNHAVEARGKIVLIDEPFTDYHKTVLIRARGAEEAARFGAVACMIRSVTPFAMSLPHTGVMRYGTNDLPRIPECAITIEDAELLRRLQDRKQTPVVHLKMGAKTLPDAASRNVIAELRGREKPDEVVVIGGHIDSWDVTAGAIDDGGGCIVAWEAVRLMQKLGLRPRRTIRVVLWTNEENGVQGAKTYRQQHKDELDKHVVAIESDSGVFKPTGFLFAGSAKGAGLILEISQLLHNINADAVHLGADNADNGKLQPDGVPIMDLDVNMDRYFWYHHTTADSVDKIDPAELNLCTAAMAVMSYVIADMPETLPR